MNAVIVALGLYSVAVIEESITLICTNVGFILVCASLCLVSVVDERARLERQVRELEEQRKKVQDERERIVAKYEVMEKLTTVWASRTMPCLEVFKEVCQQLRDTPTEFKANYIARVCTGLERLCEGCGDLAMWHGHGALDFSLLTKVADQVRNVVRRIGALSGTPDAFTRDITSDIVKCFELPGFLQVRILACYNLTNKATWSTAGSISSPYVIAQVAGTGLRTSTRTDTLDPVWEEAEEKEFSTADFIALTVEDECLKLEVWDDKSRNAMGYLNVYFKEFSPGFWHRKREKLYSHRTHKVRGSGEIEFEIYYASTMRVAQPDWARLPDARATRAFRLSAFLD